MNSEISPILFSQRQIEENCFHLHASQMGILIDHSMDEKEERFAAFGVDLDARFWCPSTGTCLSSFVLLKKNGKILLGRIAQPMLWIKKWALPPDVSKRPDVFRWLIPACHLKYGEHPAEAAKRVVEEILGLSSYQVSFCECQSHISERGHWDLCFIFEAQTEQRIETPPWFSELVYKDPRELTVSDLGRGHYDILSCHLLRLVDRNNPMS